MIRLTDRDLLIIKEINRWYVITGKQIQFLVGFAGSRSANKRLTKLCQYGYVARRKYLYGVPYLYYLTDTACKMIHVKKRTNAMKLDNINHDIIVLNCVIFFKQKYDLPLNKFLSEKQLHEIDGFGGRKHRPDFIFFKDGQKICVEVELTLKARKRFENNIKDNFLTYDVQIWIVPDINSKITKILDENKNTYPNIEIMDLNTLQEEREWIN